MDMSSFSEVERSSGEEKRVRDRESGKGEGERSSGEENRVRDRTEYYIMILLRHFKGALSLSPCLFLSLSFSLSLAPSLSLKLKLKLQCGKAA